MQERYRNCFVGEKRRVKFKFRQTAVRCSVVGQVLDSFALNRATVYRNRDEGELATIAFTVGSTEMMEL